MTTHRALLLILALLPLAPSCSGGYDTEEATTRCVEERKRIGACFDDGVMNECIACFEDCGSDCSLVSGAICAYTCD